AELVFAFAKGHGTDLRPIRAMLVDALKKANFIVSPLSLNDLLWRGVHGTKYYAQPGHLREPQVLELANPYRQESGQADVVVRYALNHIDSMRDDKFAQARAG